MKKSVLALLAFGSVFLPALAPSASADTRVVISSGDDCCWRRDPYYYHHHHGWGRPVYVEPPPAVIYAPPPVVYAPPPTVIYGAPPAPVYAPPPVAYSGPPPGTVNAAPTSPVFVDNQGRSCREYQTSVVVGGTARPSYGTACRQPDGSWRIVQ